jgi:hypothetical protein
MPVLTNTCMNTLLVYLLTPWHYSSDGHKPPLIRLAAFSFYRNLKPDMAGVSWPLNHHQSADNEVISITMEIAWVRKTGWILFEHTLCSCPLMPQVCYTLNMQQNYITVTLLDPTHNLKFHCGLLVKYYNKTHTQTLCVPPDTSRISRCWSKAL